MEWAAGWTRPRNSWRFRLLHHARAGPGYRRPAAGALDNAYPIAAVQETNTAGNNVVLRRKSREDLHVVAALVSDLYLDRLDESVMVYGHRVANAVASPQRC